jgi:hypothetical protein
MKTFLMVVLVIVASVMLFFTYIKANYKPTPAQIERGVAKSESNDRILSLIKKEPKVLEAFATEVGVLYVSVRDDGTNRNGYAEYLCQVLRDNHSNLDRVKVVKSGSTNDKKRDNSYGVLLGESWCK